MSQTNQVIGTIEKKIDQTNQKIKVIDNKLNNIPSNLRLITSPHIYANAYNFAREGEIAYIYEITYTIDSKRKDDTKQILSYVVDYTFIRSTFLMIFVEEYLINDDKPENTTYVVRVLTINPINQNTLDNILKKKNYFHKGNGISFNKTTGRDAGEEEIHIRNIYWVIKHACLIESNLSITSFDQIYTFDKLHTV
jgi:hypothetical protein